ARLFRSMGFDVIDASLEYDGQYVIQTARPTDGPTTASLAVEDDMPQLREAVASFSHTIRSRIESWGNRIRDAASRGRRIALWGSGSKGVAFLTTLRITDQVQAVVDINPHKHGKFMPG